MRSRQRSSPASTSRLERGDALRARRRRRSPPRSRASRSASQAVDLVERAAPRPARAARARSARASGARPRPELARPLAGPSRSPAARTPRPGPPRARARARARQRSRAASTSRRAVGEAPDLALAAPAVGVRVERVADAAQHDAQRQPGEPPLADEVPVRVREEERVAAARDEVLLDRLVVVGLGVRRSRRSPARPRRLRSQIRRSPVRVRTGSTASIDGISAASVSARPPVATTRAGSPSSARMRPMRPSHIARVAEVEAGLHRADGGAADHPARDRARRRAAAAPRAGRARRR